MVKDYLAAYLAGPETNSAFWLSRLGGDIHPRQFRASVGAGALAIATLTKPITLVATTATAGQRQATGVGRRAHDVPASRCRPTCPRRRRTATASAQFPTGRERMRCDPAAPFRSSPRLEARSDGERECWVRTALYTSHRKLRRNLVIQHHTVPFPCCRPSLLRIRECTGRRRSAWDRRVPGAP